MVRWRTKSRGRLGLIKRAGAVTRFGTVRHSQPLASSTNVSSSQILTGMPVSPSAPYGPRRPVCAVVQSFMPANQGNSAGAWMSTTIARALVAPTHRADAKTPSCHISTAVPGCTPNLGRSFWNGPAAQVQELTASPGSDSKSAFFSPWPSPRKSLFTAI